MEKQIFFAHSGGPQEKPGQGSYDFVQWLTRNLGKNFKSMILLLRIPIIPTYEMWKRCSTGSLQSEWRCFFDWPLIGRLNPAQIPF
jgi:hypothetical protein